MNSLQKILPLLVCAISLLSCWDKRKDTDPVEPKLTVTIEKYGKQIGGKK